LRVGKVGASGQQAEGEHASDGTSEAHVAHCCLSQLNIRIFITHGKILPLFFGCWI
jgi:hypothetical protein